MSRYALSFQNEDEVYVESLEAPYNMERRRNALTVMELREELVDHYQSKADFFRDASSAELLDYFGLLE